MLGYPDQRSSRFIVEPGIGGKGNCLLWHGRIHTDHFQVTFGKRLLLHGSFQHKFYAVSLLPLHPLVDATSRLLVG
jgi:hypothetical protein